MKIGFFGAGKMAEGILSAIEDKKNVVMAEKIDALDLAYVLILEGQSRDLAETVVRATKDQDQTILTLNSMQTVIPTDKTDGEAYLSIMEDNLTVLCQALGAPIRSEVSEADTVEL